MAKKLNLIFDFNNIAMRALFTCGYAAGEESVSTFDTDRECAVLIRKIATDMSYIMRLFRPDRVIIACDAKTPWRNDLYDASEDEEYKGTRVKDTTKNWDKIWESLNDYKNILKNRGFVVTELNRAEADDLAALWKQNLYTESGDNVVFVSSDKDWLQLIDFAPVTKTFCACFNPIANNKGQKKFFLTEEFNNYLNAPTEKADIFFTSYNPAKEIIKTLNTRDTKVNFEIINPNMIALEKIMCGDDGDNAPSFYQYYKNGKKTRVTPTKAKKIFEELNITTVHDLTMVNEANELKPKIESVMKKALDDIDVTERLIRQRRLVELNPILFPNEILSSFSYHLQDTLNDGYLSTDDVRLDYILKDTKYLSKDYNKPRENKIFDNLKDLEKFIPGYNNVTPVAKELF